MKIDRRSFLSLGAGATAGIVLSPLPWKITDDIAIWTQNWPWTPVPPDGEISYKDSVCGFCPAACGISVKTIEGRPIKIEGKKGFPISNGNACLLGLSGLQLLYSPSRIKAPLKRVGNRGENKWETITSEDAINLLVEKLKELRATGKSDGLAGISGSQGVDKALLKRFFKVYGSKNLFDNPSITDNFECLVSSVHKTNKQVNFDFENSDFILSFGAGLVDGFNSPVRMFKANSNWKEKKATLIQVEPYLSNTAAIANKWIAVKAGTEAVLALGLANVIIKESLYDKDFVARNGKNFADFKKLVSSYEASKVAEITGIKEEDIINLAKGFARASKPVVVFARGTYDSSISLNEAIAFHSLNFLSGSINKSGGLVLTNQYKYLAFGEPSLDNIANQAQSKEKIDESNSKQFPNSSNLLNKMVALINSDKKQAPAIFIVDKANPIYTLSNTKEVLNAFSKIPFIVSFSSFMDETSAYADLIIPNHIYLERYEDYTLTNGVNFAGVALSKPLVKPLFNTVDFGDALIQTANKLGFSKSFEWDNYQDCLEKTLGAKWSKLNSDGYIEEKGKLSWAGDIGFSFPDSFLKEMANFISVSLEGSETDFPLTLIPASSIRLSTNYIANTPFVTKTVPDFILKGKQSVVLINPETAKKYKLKKNDDIVISTPIIDKIKAKVHIAEEIVENTIAMNKGLGHSAYDDYLKDKGTNFNSLTNYIEDKSSGFDAAYGVRAKITRG